MKKAFTLAEVFMAKRTSGMKNSILHSRESEPKEPSNKNKKFVAFTLAEVLITLAVIGVVAALTIPALVHKYQNKQYYTQFMKTYNTLSNAMQSAIAEHGNPKNWITYTSNWDANRIAVMDDFITPFLKVSKTCNTSESGCISYDKVEALGEEGSDWDSDEFYGKVAYLQDGAMIGIFEANGSEIIFSFDTNGAKGPNRLGRDVFMLPYNFNAGRFKPFDWEPENSGSSDSSYSYSDYDRCSSSPDSDGDACATRLLLEGKMNY